MWWMAEICSRRDGCDKEVLDGEQANRVAAAEASLPLTHSTTHIPQTLQEMEGLVGEVGRAHSGAALELHGRKQREAALQREISRQRAALAEASHKIRCVRGVGGVARRHVMPAEAGVPQGRPSCLPTRPPPLPARLPCACLILHLRTYLHAALPMTAGRCSATSRWLPNTSKRPTSSRQRSNACSSRMPLLRARVAARKRARAWQRGAPAQRPAWAKRSGAMPAWFCLGCC